MHASADCLPCVLRQTLLAARRVTEDPWLHRKLLFAVMESLPSFQFDRTPAELSYECLRFASKYLGVADPFRDDKARFTAKMLAAESRMRQEILAAADPLLAAVRFALAGNVIDLGILDNSRVDEELARDAHALDLALDDTAALRAALDGARSVLYLLDNAGEIVCDKLLIEQFHLPQVTCVVRKAPIINDVTREDAEAVGLGRLAKIVDIGVEALGVPLSRCSAEFRRLFADVDVVISKGQANFETLDDADRAVFHILRAKCDTIAAYLGVSRGAAVVVRTPRQAPDQGGAGGQRPTPQ